MRASNEDYEEHRRLIRYVASKVLRRVHAAGAKTVMLEDVIGELNIAWVIARQTFNQEQHPGVPFVAYLRRGMFMHINRWVEMELRVYKIAPFDMDRHIGGESYDNVQTDEALQRDAADQVPDAEDLLIEQETRQRFYANLSPITRQFVEILENPPIELLEGVEALQARSVFARSRGINSTAPKTVSPQVVFDFMGYTRPERTQVYEEIRAATTKVSQ